MGVVKRMERTGLPAPANSTTHQELIRGTRHRRPADFRRNFQTSLSMLLPATIHRAPSSTKTLAACRGRQGVFGTSYQLTPSAEYQTSLRLALWYPSSTHSRSSKTATSWYCLGSQGALSTCRSHRTPSALLQTLL